MPCFKKCTNEKKKVLVLGSKINWVPKGYMPKFYSQLNGNRYFFSAIYVHESRNILQFINIVC